MNSGTTGIGSGLLDRSRFHTFHLHDSRYALSYVRIIGGVAKW